MATISPIQKQFLRKIALNVNWIIDENILNSPSNVGDMVAAVKDSGANLYLTKYIPLSDEQDYGPEIFDHEPTILYGTVSFVQKCKRPFFPGSFGVSELMNCNHYYSHIPNEWMLNSDFIMLPFSSILNKSEELFDIFNGSFFIRPNSGFKTFTGFVVNHDTIQHEIKSSMQLTSVMPETICLLASTKKIKGEFRFIVGNKKVIDGSEYRWDNILDVRRDYPKECFQLANKMAKHYWQPDDVYTVDIALTDVGSKIVEINSFSCAGLYACDRNIIVKELNEIARKMYNGDV